MGKNKGRQQKRNQAKENAKHANKPRKQSKKEETSLTKKLVVGGVLLAMLGVALAKGYLMIAGGLGGSSAYVTRIDATDAAMLKVVFKDPEPWVVVCNPHEATDHNGGALGHLRTHDCAAASFAACWLHTQQTRHRSPLSDLSLTHTHTSPPLSLVHHARTFAAAPKLYADVAKAVAKSGIKFGLMNCGELLPSGVDVYERFKVKEETKGGAATLIIATNGRKPKKIPGSATRSAARLKKFLKQKTSVSKKVIVNDNALQKLCKPKKGQKEGVTCVLVLSPGKWSKKKDLRKTFAEFSTTGVARAMRYGVVNAKKLKFQGGLGPILLAAVAGGSAPAPKPTDEGGDDDELMEWTRMMRKRVSTKPHVVVIRNVEKDPDTAPVGLVAAVHSKPFTPAAINAFIERAAGEATYEAVVAPLGEALKAGVKRTAKQKAQHDAIVKRQRARAKKKRKELRAARKKDRDEARAKAAAEKAARADETAAEKATRLAREAKRREEMAKEQADIVQTVGEDEDGDEYGEDGEDDDGEDDDSEGGDGAYGDDEGEEEEEDVEELDEEEEEEDVEEL